MISEQMPTRLVRPLWAALGLLSVALGFIGIVLPILPTTPFMLLAAFCFSKGAPGLRRWIEAHPRFADPIRDWERSGAIAPRYKRIAVVMMAAAFCLSLAMGLAVHILLIQALCLCGAGVFVLTRPSA